MPWNTSTRRADLPSDWPRRRARILKRDGHRCRIQGPMCVGVATEVDHTGARDDHRDEMLRAACSPCHQDRSSRQGAAAWNAARRRRMALRYRKPEEHPGLIT